MTDTLRSICAQCTHLNNPRLEFIPTELMRHKEIILRDLRELVAVACSEHEKACVVLAGCILEAILFTFLQGHEKDAKLRRGESFTFDPTRSLRYYLGIFNECFRKDFPNLQLSNEVVSYRDLVHINRELRAQPGDCRQGAITLLKTLDTLVGELSNYGRDSR